MRNDSASKKRHDAIAHASRRSGAHHYVTPGYRPHGSGAEHDPLLRLRRQATASWLTNPAGPIDVGIALTDRNLIPARYTGAAPRPREGALVRASRYTTGFLLTGLALAPAGCTGASGSWPHISDYLPVGDILRGQSNRARFRGVSSRRPACDVPGRHAARIDRPNREAIPCHGHRGG